MLPPPTTQKAVTGTQQTPAVAVGADSLLIDMANAAAKEVILLEVKEISVSIPQRKKYDLCFTKNYLYTKQVGTTTPVQGMVYDWSQIGACLWTFCVASNPGGKHRLTRNQQNSSSTHPFPRSNNYNLTTSSSLATRLLPPRNPFPRQTSSRSSSLCLPARQNQASSGATLRRPRHRCRTATAPSCTGPSAASCSL